MRSYEHKILDDTVSINTASEIVDVRHLTFLSFHVIATGTLDADVELQVSNDGINFVKVSSTSQNFSGNSNVIIEVVDICVGYVRVYLTANTGSSTVVIKMINKGIT